MHPLIIEVLKKNNKYLKFNLDIVALRIPYISFIVFIISLIFSIFLKVIPLIGNFLI